MVEDWDKYKDKKYYDHLCGCGCDGRIEVRSHHRYAGIPKFIKGHNFRGRAWNSGLTKESGSRVAKAAESNRGKHFCTEEEKDRRAEIQIKKVNKFRVMGFIHDGEVDKNRMDQAFSYLVGYWIGDGLRKNAKYLGFAVRNNKKYIHNLLEKVSLVFGKPIRYQYCESSHALCFYRESRTLVNTIREEIKEKKIIRQHPWHFLVGFLDSDGWISRTSSSPNSHIGICISNTNMNYLLMAREILDSLFIPSNMVYSGGLAEGHKPSWWLCIATISGVYVASHKILPITVDEKKKKLCRKFVETFEEKHLKQTIPICETFTSIQGEGTNAGSIQFFIRAATCDMHCRICDSKYSWKGGKRTSLGELVKLAEKSGIKSVCLTGGEIAQFGHKLSALVGLLRSKDFHIVLQTNGLHYYRSFDLIHTVGMDMKTPSTGEKSNESLILKLKSKDEIKTLIHDMKDYEYAVKINKIVEGVGCKQILQPLNLVGEDTISGLLGKYRWISELVAKDRRWGSNVRVIPQMHVLLWGNKRGV